MRNYKVVRLIDGERCRWVVVSVSLRDDDTWDVIAEFPTRGEALDYRDEVRDRNRRLAAEPVG